ncbi:MAG TPA: sugar transferase, partial [Egibacteraceae bacterium]|nr:sugar transferase [Egibacteraceae bacterium]
MNEDLRARSTDRREIVIPELPLLTRLNERGFRLVMIADALVLFAGMAIVQLRFLERSPTYPVSHYAVAFIAYTVLFLATYYFGGLYDRELRLGHRPTLPLVASLTFGPWLLLALTELLTGRFYVPRWNLPLLLVFGTVGVAANRRIARALRIQREGRPRVLLVGVPDEVNLARSHLPEDHGEAVVAGATGTTDGLIENVEATGASDVLLLNGRMLDDIYPEPLTTLEHNGIGVLQRVTARDTLLGLEGVREIAGMPFVVLRTRPLPASRARFKRTIELAGLILAAPVIVPTLALVALYVRVVAGPPVLFRQDRVGQDGRIFRMLKFRTMYPNAEEGVGAVLAKHGDPRIVPACQWLRSTRLDELPQMWNVLRGQMSVVGPRPERPELTAQYEELIPGYARRHE